tara:strand:+ start:560 stop:1030 length:471 start_codon:yes stop_codon:yes gene_type:complete
MSNFDQKKDSLEAKNISDYLKSNDKLKLIINKAYKINNLQKNCEKSIPFFLKNCEILQLTEKKLIISVPNASIASRLRQLIPKLKSDLQKKGNEIEEIFLKIKIKTKLSEINKKINNKLSPNSINYFKDLEKTIEENSENYNLLNAINNLIKRRKF